MLATWLSYDDLERLVTACLTTPVLGHAIVYGMSDNSNVWWDNTSARHIGFRPQDSSETFRAALEARQPTHRSQRPRVHLPGRRLRAHRPVRVSPLTAPFHQQPHWRHRDEQPQNRDHRRRRHWPLLPGPPRRWWRRRRPCEGHRRAPARLPRRWRRSSAWARSSRRPPTGAYKIQMFPVDAARRREGDDRAGAGRRDRRSRASRWARWARWSPTLNVFNMPFVFRDEAHMRKVIDGPIGQEMLDKLTASPARWWRSAGWTPARATCTPTSRCTKPADLKGHEDPHDGQPAVRRHHERDGRQRHRMGFNELYGALQTGVVDGAENNPPTLLAQNHYTAGARSTASPAT